MQEFTSKNTSINYVKLPALYNKIDWKKFEKQFVFDYGCGNPITQANLKEFLKSKGVIYLGYDKYWTSDSYNNITKASLIVCANVLNVIKEDKEVQYIIDSIISMNKPFVIQVYEGYKSGIGKQTGNDQYQRNLRTKDYLNYFNWKGIDVIVYKGCIIRKRDKHLLQAKKSLV